MNAKKTNLLELLPHYCWPKVDFLKNNEWPDVVMEISGRAAVKSIGNAHLNLVAIIDQLVKLHKDNKLNHGYDILCMLYEETNVENSVASDIRNAINYGNYPESMFEFNIPKTSRKWIDIKLGNFVSRIWFAHGSGGKYLNIKGWSPLIYTIVGDDGKPRTIKNQWFCLWLYELDNFVTWVPSDVDQCVATMVRGDNNADNFHVLIEMNYPRTGSNGMWTIDYLAIKEKEELFRKKMHEKYPDRGEFKKISFYCSKFNVLDMWVDNEHPKTFLDEFHRFTNEKQRRNMLQLAAADRNSFNWIYLGMEIAGDNAIFPNLHRDRHYGVHENFNPDFLSVGVDIGDVDACCASLRGVEFAKPRRYINGHWEEAKPMRVQDGIMCLWQSTRWEECEFTVRPYEDIQPGIYTYKDIPTWIQTDLIQFLKRVQAHFPLKVINVYVEYADANSPKYVSLINQIFAGTSVRAVPNWCKGEISDRILITQLMLARPGFYKNNCSSEIKCLQSLKWKDAREKEEKPLVVYDKTSDASQKYFDYFDAAIGYVWPADLINTMKNKLLDISDYNPS